MTSLLRGISVPDLLALFAAIAIWQAFAVISDHSRWTARGLSALINRQREVWMRRLVERDLLVSDSSLVGNIMHSISFLASASLILLGAVAAMLGNLDHTYDAVMAIPFVATGPKEMFALKLVWLALLLIYSFLQFTWSLRQFNYCCIVLGTAPNAAAPDPDKTAFVARTSRIGALGARSFNQGLRGHYLVLASLGWFVHPIAFVGAVLAMVLVLWRREFHSHTRRALREG